MHNGCCVLQAAVNRLSKVQQQRDTLQKSVPAAAHYAITGSSPDEFLQQAFKKAQHQFIRVTRSAATDPHTDAAEAAARITAVKECVEFGDSAVHLQSAVRIVQKQVYG